ncbi:MAG: aldehyde dehydrogenase family protein, partial [Phycisphaerales bacterium]
MPLKTAKNYINGRWAGAQNASYLDVENPSTGKVIARTPLSTKEEANRAIEAAAEAYDGWSKTPVARRVKPLYKLARLLEQNEEEIARTLVEEMGKSLPDARAELKRTLENCEVACGMPVLAMGDILSGCSYGIDGEVLRLPLGVFTMIAPFNFPAMVPFWFLPYALATGNTYVVKASEQVPLTMQFVTELIDQVGLPPGVFNLVNGDRIVAEAFLEHKKVKGVSIVGRSATCRAIAQKCAQTNKRFQAMGGAKNHLVVMPDAKVDQVIRNMVTSCYGCAGQRCMAASAIVPVGHKMYRTVCEKFIEASQEVLVADPLDPNVADEPMVMGPVISANAKEFILEMIAVGAEEGATLALDGRDIVIPGCEKGYFIGPTVFTD